MRQVEQERRTAWAGERVGMLSFADSGPAIAAIEEDLARTIDAVVAGRARDRERGETEIPFVVVAEGVLERVVRARRIYGAIRAKRDGVDEPRRRFLGLVRDAAERLDAFAATYEEKRMVEPASPTSLARVLARVEADAALERDPGAHADAGALGPPAVEGEPPRITTSAPALEDLLRAARAEAPLASPPWRVSRDRARGALSIAIGARAGEKAPPDGAGRLRPSTRPHRPRGANRGARPRRLPAPRPGADGETRASS